ncbi:MAG: glycosyltransferase [Patescibacteria group bacterium]|jgi:glycosyltransferase involved in cell wall biosynthesis/4-amino-4-deoxy-L-arabinose transferase-like glycosyltransferase
MKILLATGIYPPESGGPATYTAGLASALRAQGHSVEVLAYGDSRLKNDHVTRVSRRGGAIVRYVRYAWHAFRLARRSDVVYAQGPVSEGLPATIGARLAGRKITMKVVGDYAWEMAMQNGEKKLLDEYLESKPNGQLSRIERWTARNAERVIVPSRYLKTVVEKWGVASERIHVVVNANEPLPDKKGRKNEREALGVVDRVVLLTAVRAVPWKGVGDLIAWMKDLPSSHLLVVAGDGPELENWKKAAQENGVTDRVRFLGRVDRAELARWYDAADAFLLNSGYEGYPHVVAEAASKGVPCFVSDKGGNPETKETFVSLVTVLPFGDKNAWTSVLRNVSIRDSLVFGASTWTHEKMVGETMETLEGKHDPLSVIMVSYDRELLDESSTTSQRVMSISGENTKIKPIVMQGKILRNIWKGIWIAKRSSSRILVTAQDPFAAGLVGYFISRITNVPLEIQEHGNFYSGEWVKESWKNRALSLIGRFILKRAERVRAVSERVKHDLVRIGVSESRIEVIPVSLDLSKFLDLPLRSMESIPHLVAPCRFVEQKGLDTLLEAATILRKNKIQFQLSIIGSGPMEALLRSQIEARGLAEIVTLEPWKEQGRLWDDADLFVMSSRYEGFGRTILEAMAAGVPIVTTDVGCVGSIFRSQIDGRVVEPNDAVALAKAIEEQIADTTRRETMRQSARDQAKAFPSQDELHAKQREGWKSVKSSGSRFELWVGAFLLFAIATRLASAFLFHDSLLNREWGFYTLVDHWFQGYGYSYATQLGCASAYRSPGYLFFLTALYSVFDPKNTLAQGLVQNAFVVGVLWLVYAVGKRFVGKRAALVAGLLMACYPYTFYHYTQYYHTFLSSFFLLLIVWFLFRITETKRYFYAVGAGLSIGCLAYVQGTILPVTPFLVAWLVWKLWPNWKRAVSFAVIMGITSAVLIAPWTYRNWIAFHKIVPLTTDLGFGAYKANNENIYALTMRGYPQEVVDEVIVSSTNPNYVQYRLRPEIEQRLKDEGAYRESFFWTAWHPKEPNAIVSTCAELGPVNEVEFSAYWNEAATKWTKEHFWSEGWKLQLLKIKTFWQPSLFPSVKTGAPWSFANNPTKVFLARAAVTGASALVIFGGLIGILYAVRRRDKNVWLPIAILVIYTVLHTFFAGYTKYRIPLDNLLAIYAGWTIVKLWDRLRGK